MSSIAEQGGWPGVIFQKLEDRSARKQALSDEDFARHRDNLLDAGTALQKQLPNYKDAKGNVIPELKDQYDQAQAALTKNEYDLGQLYHPTNNPGRLQQDWHYLRERIHGIKRPKESTTTQTPAVTLPATPAAPITTPEVPTYQQVTPRMPSQGGNITTEVPGIPSTTMSGMQSAPVTLPAGPPVTVTKEPLAWKDRGSYQSPGELKKKAAAMQKAQEDAKILESGAGLSPEQQAVVKARGEAAEKEVEADSAIKLFDHLFPDASKEDKDRFKHVVAENVLGIKEKPVLKLYTLSDGTKSWLDASRPDLIPEGATASPTENSDTRKREDYQAYLDKNPDYEKKGGTFEKWTAEQAALGRSAAPKPETLDTQYKAILVKEASGQRLTPDEIAHKAAWQLYNKETKIDPGIARAAAFGSMRYIPVVDNSDPNNAGNVIMMRAGDAAKSKASTPASIAFKTDAAITKYMTSGQGATNINYFNTAMDHLKQLQEAGENLANGNIQAFNNIAQRFNIATGQPEAVEFNAIKSAVSGELSKTFKGTGATDQEISEINQNINMAQSMDQIRGAIDVYIRLMGGKMQALQGQYTAGKQGKPNFPGTSPSGSPQAKGKHSLSKAMTLPFNKGKTADQVRKDLESYGYEVTP